ncbi:hypothetical protein THRCLA_04293 [Thraustotheca clavata]|uniref:TFIIS N-terminal domain-containing protein n=1 Tax=Thraustotheca clavata TaxID=74557 RepID=A0A1V9ZZP0_9STRA|nr:hypothetical protein THRCLA_04293 [Thraustotheca clavata]
MSSAWTSLVQAQHKGFSQLTHAFDSRVHEHESLLGVNPINGKASAKRKRSENKSPLRTIGTPGNEQEKTLVHVCDQECVVLETCIDRFLALFANAKTEPDQAKLLQVLENTVKKENQLSTNVVRAFESSGGLKTAKTWLEAAVSFNQVSFLELVLTVLKVLPLTLASITEARINEPIVALRKSASNAQVKRAAQELLKTWRSKFTEKSPKESNGSPPPKQPSPTAASTTSTRVPTKSNTLLTNLLMKPKDNKPTKVKDLTITKMLKEKQIKDKEVTAQAESPKTPLALPAIVSFGDVKATDVPSVASTKRIRWADNHGKELTQIQIIESWRDMIYHTEEDDKEQPMSIHPTDSFKDAKLREHANEKNAFKNKHHERLAVIKPTMEWRTPALVQLPEEVAGRPADLTTEEMTVQTNRTRKDVEWILLGTEVPPPSPHEWVRSSADIFLGPPVQIALSDGTPDDHHHEYFSPATAPVPQESSSKKDFIASTFGSLDKSTISLLLENEHILGQVYDEVLRTRRRITDARIHEILNATRHYGNAVVAPTYPAPHGYPPRPNSYSTDSSIRNSMYDHHGYPPAGTAPNKRPYDGYNDSSSYAPKRHQTAPPPLAYTPQYTPENNDPYGRAGVQRPLPMQTGGRPQVTKYNRPTYAAPSRPTANGGRGY